VYLICCCLINVVLVDGIGLGLPPMATTYRYPFSFKYQLWVSESVQVTVYALVVPDIVLDGLIA
jgi:hypothetical protein